MDHKFSLGSLVYLDPVGGFRGPKGKVIGQIEYIDGTVGYVVSSSDLGNGITRHFVNEIDLTAVPDQTGKPRP